MPEGHAGTTACKSTLRDAAGKSNFLSEVF
jgi:hypothetical protein